MGKRRENRALVSIPVVVSGTDLNGNPFSQTAQTIDVSRTGARLNGIRCLRGAGELVTIESGLRSARFRVVWIGIPGSSEDGHFGVKSLQPDKRIFKVDPGVSDADVYSPPVKQQPATQAVSATPARSEPWNGVERRSTPRIRCVGTGQITQPGISYPIWVRLTDLSMGGCYVEVTTVFPKLLKTDVSLTVRGRTFTAKGTVITSHPGVGVGIKFTSLTDEGRQVLIEVLRELIAAKRPLPPPFGS